MHAYIVVIHVHVYMYHMHHTASWQSVEAPDADSEYTKRVPTAVYSCAHVHPPLLILELWNQTSATGTCIYSVDMCAKYYV